MEIGLTAVSLLMITALIAAEIVLAVRRRRQERQRDAVLRRLQGDLHALVAGAVSVDQHLSAMEQRLRRLAERQDQLELRDPAQQAYDHAIRLIQQGADVNALMERCALARGEAELLLQVHRAPRHAAAG